MKRWPALKRSSSNFRLYKSAASIMCFANEIIKKERYRIPPSRLSGQPGDSEQRRDLGLTSLTCLSNGEKIYTSETEFGEKTVVNTEDMTQQTKDSN